MQFLLELWKGPVLKIQTPHARVTKVLTRIQGFDEITDGGLPRGRTTLVVGGPGCGKTVFALRAPVNRAQRAKEAGIFVAFEESTGQIVVNAATFGWNLPALVKKKLFFPRLRLYIAGNAPNSLRAVANLRAICDEHFSSGHELEIVDLLARPKRALAGSTIVTPTLLKLLPLPVRRVIGNLSDTNQLLLALAGI